MITAGEGKHKVWLDKIELEHGIVYVLGGGGRSHIGGAVYAEPGEGEKVIKLEDHRDLEVLIPIAREASAKYGLPVLATGGIHIDNATKEEIEHIVKNCKELLKCI
ncbi:MAG: hypothetical protein Q7J68_05810 [Thermoplasmata archaeon]|nr:hypothetical protein [Thermoplasmata archaeon]